MTKAPHVMMNAPRIMKFDDLRQSWLSIFLHAAGFEIVH